MQSCLCRRPASHTCGQCRQAVYCSQECQKSDWVNHQFICAKRPREEEEEVEPIKFKVYESIKDFIKLIPKEERNAFYFTLASFIHQTLCQSSLFDAIDLARELKKDVISYWFFSQKPTTKEDIMNYLVGVVKVEDYGNSQLYIDRFCSRNGREMFLWMEKKFPQINTWILDSIAKALVFWLKVGFHFQERQQEETERFLLKMYEKYDDDVIRILEDEYQADLNIPYYDAMRITDTVIPLMSEDVFPLYFKRNVLKSDQPTLFEFMQKDDTFVSYSIQQLFRLLNLTHPKEKKIFFDEILLIVSKMCQHQNLILDLKSGDFFYRKRPRTRQEVLYQLKGFILLNDEANEIETFCATPGNGGLIIEQLQEKLPDDEDLHLLAIPSAVTFWMSMGFRIENANDKDVRFLERQVREHGYQVVSQWLEHPETTDATFKKRIIRRYQLPDRTFQMTYNRLQEAAWNE